MDEDKKDTDRIFGIGIDIIEVERIKSAVNSNALFLKKVFSEKEISYCSSKKNSDVMYVCFAQRFAAKEAVLKSFGLGVLGKIKLNEIEIINNDKGKPIVNLLGKANLFALRNNIKRVEISLSGVKNYAIAFAISLL